MNLESERNGVLLRKADMRTRFFHPVALILLAVVVIGSMPAQARAATVVTFTTVGSTTWTVPAGVTSVQVLVVAGGGSGGASGGGGGGGVVYAPTYAVTPSAGITVTVGAGGASVTTNVAGNAGANSVFGTITAVGGGGGGAHGVTAVAGGSGGGGGTGGTYTAGAATQANSGGGIGYGKAGGAGGSSTAPYAAGGGGGAVAVGSAANGATAGAGGQGYLSNITGTNKYYAGGGGGGTQQSGGIGGAGGAGGGGGGGCYLGTAGAAGANGGTAGTCTGGASGYGTGGAGGANTGGGGGGPSISVGTSGAGGSGIVVVSYGAPNITLSQNTTVTGSASVLGTISKGSGTFVIDDPLDPKNKLLYHSFVESPDVMNIYDGIAQLDGAGSATITLPDYFLALNYDFRYLTTPIGQPMPNLYISSEVHRRFWIFRQIIMKVSGGVAGGKISWQVTGIRHDPFILANPIVPIVDKGPDQLVDKGKYLFPEFYAK